MFYNSQENPQTIPVLTEEMKAVQSKYITKVYTLMAFALAVTGLCAYTMSSNTAFITYMMTHKMLFYGLMIAEIGLVFYLSARVFKLSYASAMGMFMVYSILNGLTLSMLFLIYTASSIATTFFITAGTFAAMSIYGYTTKSDLTRLGKIAMMLLIGLIIATVVNIFIHSTAMYWIISYVGVFIFVALIAYDTQRLKRIFGQAQDNEELMKKVSIMGALTLYLDFINLFIFLLRIFGGGSRD